FSVATTSLADTVGVALKMVRISSLLFTGFLEDGAAALTFAFGAFFFPGFSFFLTPYTKFSLTSIPFAFRWAATSLTDAAGWSASTALIASLLFTSALAFAITD